MNRLLSAFLLFCLGLAVPLAATPMRLCRIDHRLMIGGNDECRTEAGKPCCQKCTKERKPAKDCCRDLDPLPQSQKPTSPDPLPPLSAMDLPPPAFAPPALVECSLAPRLVSGPIRGPDPSPPHRSWWGVWRL